MTGRRKLLIGVAATLMCTNALALLLPQPEPAEALWFGMNFEDDGQDFADGRSPNYPAETVQLHRDGASKNGQSVPYTSMIDNMGRAAYLEMITFCHYGCRSNPWIARAFVDDDTPISVVISAYRAARSICKSDVIIGTMFASNFTIYNDSVYSGAGFPLMITHFGDPAIGEFGAIHPWNPTLAPSPTAETLDDFALESGCGSVSPLRP